MTVAVNVRALSRRITGVERYTREVLIRLKDRLRLLAPDRALNGAIGHLWEQAYLPALLYKGETLWSPANTGPLSVSNQVLTLHDASFVDHPEWFETSFAAWYGFLLPRLLRRVSLVLTPSIFSKIRILDAFRISDQRVKVIPGGVDPKRFQPVTTDERSSMRERLDLQKPYVLALGSLSGRKNLLRLLEAWQRRGRVLREVELVLAGDEAAGLRKLRFNHLPEDVRLTGRVDEASLAALYSAALAFVAPSLYEGFGLTVLEAMACGTPVIASNTSAFPEVVGGAGLLINPMDEGDLLWAVQRAVQDSALRQDLISKGFERVKEFSWDRTAEGVWTSILQVHPYKESDIPSTHGR